jgi:signal peptidase I
LIILGAAFAVLVFQTSVVGNYKIPTGSMIPTLLVGDFLLVSKMAYAIKLPLPFTNINLFRLGVPTRGDVIVFQFPDQPSLDYIKRVVGLPGDKIELRGPIVYINDEPLKTVQAEELSGKNNLGMQINIYTEPLGEKEHQIQHIQYLERRNFGPIEVPADSFFVLGDNRDNSRDSRIWGVVPFDHIRGRALMTWISWDSEKRRWIDRFRIERLFKVVD